jgi:hypothetical protein
MSKRIGYAASASAFAGLLVVGSAPAQAKDKEHVDKITCEEFLAMKPGDQTRIAYFVEGYRQAKDEAVVGTVAYDEKGEPVAALVKECKVAPKETLWQKIRRHV